MLVHFLAVTARLQTEIPSRKVLWERKCTTTTTTDFYFSFKLGFGLQEFNIKDILSELK